jgi:hypothetical protein
MFHSIIICDEVLESILGQVKKKWGEASFAVLLALFFFVLIKKEPKKIKAVFIF